VSLLPTWSEFAWAVFLYGIINKDITGKSKYLKLMSKPQFLKNFRTNPTSWKPEEIQEKIIKGFLNPWRCRIPNTIQAASAVQKEVQKLQPDLNVLQNYTIENAPFNQADNCNVIKRCYNSIRRRIGHRFGPRATSKLLHILQPKLFVMWDKPILEHYHKSIQEFRTAETATSPSYKS